MPGRRPRSRSSRRRAGGRGQRDRVAVAAEAAGHPEDVDDQALGLRWPRAELGVRLTRPAARRAVARCAARRGAWAGRARRGTRGARRACRAGASSSARPGHEARRPKGARARARPTGARPPTSWPSRRWVSGSEADAARLDRPPARREVPQQQRQAHLEARLGGDRPLHVEVVGARPARRSSARAIWGHGRTRSAKPASSTATRVGHENVPRRSARQQLVGAAVARLQQVAGADELGGRAVADLDVEREHAVEQQQPQAAAGRRRTSGPGRTRRPGSRTRRRSPPGGRPMRMRMSNSCGEVVVDVEQVAVRRGGARLSRVARRRRCAGTDGDMRAPRHRQPPSKPCLAGVRRRTASDALVTGLPCAAGNRDYG